MNKEQIKEAQYEFVGESVINYGYIDFNDYKFQRLFKMTKTKQQKYIADWCDTKNYDCTFLEDEEGMRVDFIKVGASVW
jgi:hypothetical protein